jgi:hypothetical protein
MEADMRSKLSRGLIATLACGSTAAALSMTVGGAALAATGRQAQVQDPVPIGVNQTFSGYVNNGPPGTIIIAVACTVGDKTGHPLAKQPVEVKPVASSSTADNGFTGSKGDKITASLAPTTAATIIASFTSYYVKKDIPTGITVPCSGTGTMLFVPSPTSKTAKTAKLTVTFGNITAKRA